MHDDRRASVGPHVEERDPSRLYFDPEYLFAGEDVRLHSDAAFTADLPQGNSVDDTPDWTTAPPSEELAPISQGGQNEGANSGWNFWPAKKTSIQITLPSGADIRSLWLPSVPVAMQFSYGLGGSLMYGINLTGGEIVPVSEGTKIVTISVAPGTAKPDIWIFATLSEWAPTKSGISGSPIPAYLANPEPNTLRSQYGAIDLYALADLTGPVAADSISARSGAYSPAHILYQQPPIFDDGIFAIVMEADPTSAEQVLLPFNDVVTQPGDFTLEIEYEKISDTTGFAAGVPLFANEDAGPAGGFVISDGGNQIGVDMVLNTGRVHWAQNGNILLGSKNHIVLAVSPANERMTLYINGVAITMNPGPGAPPFGAWATTYKPAVTQMAIGQRLVGANSPGKLQNACLYPSELTSAQVVKLYGAIVNG